MQGDAGRYSVRLTATAPAPVLTSMTISPNPVKGGDRATATLVFSGPVLPGGSYISLATSSGFTASPISSQQVAAGATRFTVTIATGRVSANTPVTLTGRMSFIGPSVPVVLTVKK